VITAPAARLCLGLSAAGLQRLHEGEERIAQVVAADLDDVERIRRRRIAGGIQEGLYLRGEVGPAAVGSGSRAADREVGGARCVTECGVHATGEPERPRHLLDPRRAVAEMLAAARIGTVGHEERVDRVVGGRARRAEQDKGVAGIRKACRRTRRAGRGRFARPPIEGQRREEARSRRRAAEALCA
jgi:hypothetical protein